MEMFKVLYSVHTLNHGRQMDDTGKWARERISELKNLNFLKANRKDFASGRKLSSMKKSTNDENF